MSSTLGLQVRDTGSNPVVVHFHSSFTCLDPLTFLNNSEHLLASILNNFIHFLQNDQLPYSI